MKSVQMNLSAHIGAWHDWDTHQKRDSFWKNTAIIITPALIFLGLFTWQTFHHAMKLTEAQTMGAHYGGDVTALATFGALALIYMLLTLPALFAGVVRRLKDAGASPSWSLLFFLGFWGWLILAFFLCQPSDTKN